MPSDFYCYECGDELTVSSRISKKTGEIVVDFWCEDCCDECYSIRMLTGVKEKDFQKLLANGKAIKKEMKVERVDPEEEEEP